MCAVLCVGLEWGEPEGQNLVGGPGGPYCITELGKRLRDYRRRHSPHPVVSNRPFVSVSILWFPPLQLGPDAGRVCSFSVRMNYAHLHRCWQITPCSDCCYLFPPPLWCPSLVFAVAILTVHPVFRPMCNIYLSICAGGKQRPPTVALETRWQRKIVFLFVFTVSARVRTSFKFAPHSQPLNDGSAQTSAQ